jgi:thiamine pyrophosphokinase
MHNLDKKIEKLKNFFLKNNEIFENFQYPKSLLFLNNFEKNNDELIFIKRFIKESNYFFKEKPKIIAIDGASNPLIKEKIFPDYIIGDLDSCEQKRNDNSEYIHLNDQDYCDFEKSLKFCETKNFGPFFIFGINGGQIDRIIQNLHIFLKFSNCFNIGFSNNTIFFSLNDENKNPIKISAKNHSRISIFGFQSKNQINKFKTQGLKWDIDENFEIDFSFSRQSISNKVENFNIGEDEFLDFYIQIFSGKILLIIYL